MANIPRFYSIRGLPEKTGLVPVSPQIAGRPFEAMAGAGEKIGGLGLYAANVFDILNRAEEAVNADKIGHEIDDEYEQENLKYVERIDHINFEKDAKAFNDTSLSKWLSDPRVKENPRLAQAIEKHLRDKSATLMSGIRKQKAIIIGAEGQAQWNRDKKESILQWANEISPTKKEIIKEKLINKGLAFVNRGIISRIQHDKDIQAFDKDGEEAEIINAEASQSIEFIKHIIDKIDQKEGFKTLDSKERSAYKLRLSNHLENVKKAKQIEDDKQLIQNSYNELKSKYGSNYESMFQNLSNPEWLKNHNLTPEKKHNLEIILRAERNESYGKIQDDFLAKLQEGTLTEREVLSSALPATGLMQGDKGWFLEKLKAKMVKGDEAFIHSNPRVFGQTLKDIVLNPDKWDKNKIWALMGTSDEQGKPTGINPRDAAQLHKVWEDLKTTDPKVAQKFTSLQQVLTRLDDYRKNYFFIEPSEKDDKDNPIVTREDVIKNDQLHYLAQQDLLERIGKGEDPFEALSAIMVKPTQEKAKSWYDKWWSNVNAWFPSAPTKPLTPKPSSPPPGNKEGRYDVNGVIWNWTKAKGWYQ